MENKNKIFFIIIGIVIGSAMMMFGMLIFQGNNNDELLNQQSGLSDEHNENDNLGGVIILSDSVITELGIKTDIVGPKLLQAHVDLTGEIVVDPDKLAHIVPRFAGIVKKVYKKIGDKVSKDEVVAVIESNESLVTYNVESSIDGVVLDLHMTPGEFIGDDEHVVTVVDLSTVWAELNIYQEELNNIKVGQNVDVFFDGVDITARAKIFYISPTVDVHTRTGKARVQLNNSKSIWKPGMFINAKVYTEIETVDQAVSLTAIHNFEGQKVVFVRDGLGFRAQPVTIGKTNTIYVQILTGLNIGQIYLSDGAFVIKSELLKESFGGDHGH
ncbi:MAG: hypothetical protein CVV23_17500 [Ignavibacteriae bacterium HGW-Ignavibacteriae-2]|jgi:cobalt-zinc-cadmium efflux system membrane fusion protein|nr:MAG: hypothetical protein CVV23_17500 [Ignavibacteriae bacterium HGW-Ignavibacteriae-2]